MARHGKRRSHGRHGGEPPAAGQAEPRINGSHQAQQYRDLVNDRAECLDDRHPADRAAKAAARPQLRDVTPRSPGHDLRVAREARGLTIEDISRSTKIGAAVLMALERGDVERLPAPIFTRGFLKSYAREVGLDPDEVADLYLAQVAPETLAFDGANARLNVAEPAARSEVLRYDDDTSDFLATRQMGRFGWIVTAAAVVGLFFYIGAPGLPDDSGESTDAIVASDATPAAQAVPAAQATPEATAAVRAIETPVGPLQFELRPQGPCWLAAAADGTPVFARLLQAGEQERIEVHDELVLRVGDPAALTFSINGHPGRALGRPGEPVNVRITKENFREFISF